MEDGTRTAPTLGSTGLRLSLWGATFVLVLLVGNALLLERTGFGAETLVATLGDWLLRLTGLPVERSGVFLETAAGSIQIVGECTGLTAITLAGAFTFSFPARWRDRLTGLALAAGAIFLLNVLRVVVLVWLLQTDRDTFASVHDFGWPVFLVLAIVLYFFLWTNHASRALVRQH